ncbi:MAG: DNA polymerase I, partial [Burkholderiales bacterium]|nr:DNA polymerase I [Burkholderiales bacterium]
LLVDGSSYLYRAYHALPDLRGPGGVPTGAIHGVVAMMKRLREQYPAALGACVFDAKGPTFRDAWYAQYKANRSAMPTDLALQIEPIHEAVKLLGWPVLSVPGIEADDVIGTLAAAAAGRGFQVIVSTGDKDLAQLVGDHVTLINTMSNERLDAPGVLAKFGVPPGRIVDYLTLVGDTVDNVPGVEKVGPKTAAKWISEYGSLDGVMSAAPSMKGAAGENLRKALDWLPQARRLVTVVTDCDLNGHVPGWPGFESLALAPLEVPGLVAFYDRFGLKTFKRELESARGGSSAAASNPPAEGADAAAQASAVAPIDRRYETVLTLDALDAWRAKIEAAALTAIDTETDSLDAMRARLVGISLSVAPGEAAYIPLRHSYAGAPDQLPVDAVLARLKPWLENPAAPKLGQNIKYDTHVFANAGISVQGYAHDTMLQSYVLEAHKAHSLESLADRHLGRKGLSFEDLCGKGVHQISFAQVEIGKASEYACEDSEMTLHVHQHLWPQIQVQPGLLDVYRRIEMPTAAILGRIERTGVLIDSARLAAQSRQLAERMVALEQQAFELAGQPFNLGSPKQIGEILFGKLGMPVKRKTASGAPSTDEDVLAELAADYPLPARLLEHRGLAKLKGTYTDKLPLMVNPATGRVHTHYAQAVAVTGRLSSNDPNLQNIPIRTPEGRRVREAFIAPAGHSILSADYSQIELRIMAHISGDEGLLMAFGERLDVHRATASEVFGVPVTEVSSEQRRYAKVINFGLIYGMSAFGLAGNLGIDRTAATSYIERYFARYPGVKRYMDETKVSAREKGYVETLFGRRVYLPEINGGNGPRKSAAERQAINAPMQGTAADLIKLAMIAVQGVLDRERRATRMIMQVHDELVFEVPADELDWARTEVPRIMASVADLKVPLLAEVGVGANWDEAH